MPGAARKEAAPELRTKSLPRQGGHDEKARGRQHTSRLGEMGVQHASVEVLHHPIREDQIVDAVIAEARPVGFDRVHLRVASAKALQHRAREIHASIPALVEAEMVVQRAVSTTDLEHPAHAATVPEDAELRAVLAIVLDRARSVLW